MAPVPAVDVKELRRRLDADGPKPYLLDVREPWEYLAGHVPGATLIPLGELEQRVSSGDMAVAFALYATQMSDLMAVADAGGIMPPKSTWFEPKLADGMVNHVLD